jgi:fatty-acyl-CoA synthase
MDGVPWVDGLTIAQVLEHIATQYPDHDAMVFPRLGYRLRYAEFLREVRRTARALLALGVEPGDHVAVWATNQPPWVLIQFATAALGAVLVNVNPAYRASELRYVLEQADVSTLLLTDHFKSSDYFAILDSVLPELRATAKPRLRHIVSITNTTRPGIPSWDAFLASADSVPESALDARQAAVRPGDTASIQYTSGTTGFPKGAMLTHRNLLLNAFHVGARQLFSDADRLAIPVPLYHCFGCVLGTLVCAVYGAAMVFPAESFDALATLEALQSERCTALYGVPTMFIAELNHPRFAEFDLSCLRTGVMAGSPCPIELMRAVITRMGARELTIGYGLTEASPIITQTEPDDDLEHRVGTVGRLLPGVEVRIVRPGTMIDVPPGESGELIARGHGIMQGYYSKPAESAAAITADGWLHSGDLAMATPDGYYRITGRSKDMIIRGGENISPREIEEFLYTHPEIAEVQVVGLPDNRFGEEVSAWIRLREGSTLTDEAVRSYCRTQIAHYKVPRYVVFVDEYPTTVTGKIQKFRLRALGIERFGLQRAAGVETA